MLMGLVVGWTCVGVFIATAVITLLAAVRIIKLANDKILYALVVGVLVEIAAVCVGGFRGHIQLPSTAEKRVREAGEVALAERIKPDLDVLISSTAPASGDRKLAADRLRKRLDDTLQKKLIRPGTQPIRTP